MDSDCPLMGLSGHGSPTRTVDCRARNDFDVFLIGAMEHDPAVASEATGLLMAMVDMLDELETDPSKGLLGYTRHGEPGMGVLVQ